MQSLNTLFGESPFEHLVQHAAKIHECVALIRPIAEGIVAGDMPRLSALQEQMSKTEYEADCIKDEIREHLPRRFFLPVNREDILGITRQLDRMADDAEDFSVIATFRHLHLPDVLIASFMALVDKVVAVSEAMLDVAKDLAELQKESFEGPEAEQVLGKIKQVCHMEWESDKISREFARIVYGDIPITPVDIILAEKLVSALTGIADHAENVGKNLRLMIIRR